MRRGSLCLVGLAVVSLASMPSAWGASTRRHDVEDEQYLALGSAFPSVGVIATQDGYWGSGTLIGVYWVLTAAHVVEGAWTLPGFYLGDAAGFAVTSISIHPDYDPRTLDHDFALLQIGDGVTGHPPLHYYADPVPVGTIATSVGWGMYGTGLTGAIDLDGLKRGFMNTVDAATASYYEADFDDPDGTSSVLGSPDALPMEGITAFVDSGGALIADLGSGPGLVGVTSAGSASQPPSAYGSTSYWARVSAVAPWIETTTGITPVPEPGAWVPPAVAAALAALRRRSP